MLLREVPAGQASRRAPGPVSGSSDPAVSLSKWTPGDAPPPPETLPGIFYKEVYRGAVYPNELLGKMQ